MLGSWPSPEFPGQRPFPHFGSHPLWATGYLSFPKLGLGPTSVCQLALGPGYSHCLGRPSVQICAPSSLRCPSLSLPSRMDSCGGGWYTQL